MKHFLVLLTGVCYNLTKYSDCKMWNCAAISVADSSQNIKQKYIMIKKRNETGR